MPGGGVRHVLLVATANNTVFGFDGTSYGMLWRRHLGPPDGTDPSLKSMGGDGCLHLAPGNAMANPVQFFMGILSTPVVDYATSRIYVSYRLAGPLLTQAQQRLAALDVATGETLGDTPIGQVPGIRDRAAPPAGQPPGGQRPGVRGLRIAVRGDPILEVPRLNLCPRREDVAPGRFLQFHARPRAAGSGRRRAAWRPTSATASTS